MVNITAAFKILGNTRSKSRIFDLTQAGGFLHNPRHTHTSITGAFCPRDFKSRPPPLFEPSRQQLPHRTHPSIQASRKHGPAHCPVSLYLQQPFPLSHHRSIHRFIQRTMEKHFILPSLLLLPCLSPNRESANNAMQPVHAQRPTCTIRLHGACCRSSGSKSKGNVLAARSVTP